MIGGSGFLLSKISIRGDQSGHARIAEFDCFFLHWLKYEEIGLDFLERIVHLGEFLHKFFYHAGQYGGLKSCHQVQY